jgi:hypothetical protein
MLGWLNREIKKMFYVLCHMITGKQPKETQEIIKKYLPKDAFDLYEAILREIKESGFNHNLTVITSAENVHILMSAGFILHDENTTKLWLKGFYGEVEIAASIYHGNDYGNLVYRELPYEPKKA